MIDRASLRSRALAALAALWVGAAVSAPKPPLKASAVISVAPVAYTERTLPNGLRFVAVHSSTSPTVSVQVWYHVGSKNDPAGRSGFAHLFEHLMFKSTRYMKAEQFDRLTEDVGGSNNAFTSEDVTAYHEVVPSNHLETLLWAEAERMAHLNVDEANFKSERAVVEEEYRQRVLASPYGRFHEALSSAPYLAHPYKRSTIGSIEDLEAASLGDVVDFHRRYYRPDNATLVVTGDFDPQQLNAWVDRYFGAVPRPAEALPVFEGGEPTWTTERLVKLTGPQVPLPALAIVWQAPSVTSADAPALRIAAALLSGGESSRLSQSLVYRQQIAVQAGFAPDLRAGPGLLVAHAIAATGKPLEQVRAALLGELERLVQTPIPAAELAKVKTQLLTEALLSRQTPLGVGQSMANATVLEGGPNQINVGLKALQQVTAEQVQQTLKRYVVGTHPVSVEYRQEGAGQ